LYSKKEPPRHEDTKICPTRQPLIEWLLISEVKPSNRVDSGSTLGAFVSWWFSSFDKLDATSPRPYLQSPAAGLRWPADCLE